MTMMTCTRSETDYKPQCL